MGNSTNKIRAEIQITLIADVLEANTCFREIIRTESWEGEKEKRQTEA